METGIGSLMGTAIGLIIGYVCQFVITKILEQKKHTRELKTQAYLDYMKCVCEHGGRAFQEQSKHPKRGSQEPSNENAELDIRTNDSKGRVCLYGSSKVIHAFAVFQKLGANGATPEARNAFCEMVKDMRKDSGNRTNIDIEDISIVLWGK